MIIENSKNKVYFSALFANDYPMLYGQIREILKNEGVPCELIKGTKDYWCRDFMPVQADNQSFVQFRYHPDYLEGKRQYETDVDEVMNKHYPKLALSKNKVIADGGNIVMAPGRNGSKCVVMTSKVLYENNNLHCGDSAVCYSCAEDFIKADLGCDTVVMLPWDMEDDLGHVDGIVRFAGYSKHGIPRVLVNRKLSDKWFSGVVNKVLKRYFQVVDLKLSEYDDMSWAYINALQTDRCVIIPGIGLPTDAEALQQYTELYPEYVGHIHMILLSSF